jgi:aldehyde:ferredoxin oxidoreductase
MPETITDNFSGNLLKVDLTTGTIETKELDGPTVSQYLMGTGYATKLIWNELQPGISPLSPDNQLILTTGLLTGSSFPGSDSLFACFKSPLTNGWAESRCGAGMGVALKKAGFDVVAVKGTSHEPVYLWIENGRAELKSARHLWGKLVPETQKALKDELAQPKAKVLCIGPSGEKQVRFANIMVENLRAMGRCGGGAVMGSKNLKAVVFRGTQKLKAADPEKLAKLTKEMTALEISNPMSGLAEESGEIATFSHGTASFMPYYDKSGEIPTKNAQSNTWGRGKEMYKNLKKHVTAKEGCLNCVLKCGKRVEIKEGQWKTPAGEGPEYETLAGFGHYILNDNVEAIIHINHLCNSYGVDTISCGNAIAFAMECYEKGIINQDDTQGIALEWGDIEAAKTMVLQILERKGFGDTLAEGVYRAANTLGDAAAPFAMHVKGLELPAHDTRSAVGGKAWAIQYGTANRGMCHSHPHEPSIIYSTRSYRSAEMKEISNSLKEPYGETGKGKMMRWAQDYGNALNVLGFCCFHSYLVPGSELERYATAVLAATGLEMTFDDLMTIGERVSNLQRCFNVREGMRRKDDMVPQRLLGVPAFGPYSDKPELAIQNYGDMLDEYYLARGWDPATGIPQKEKLEDLGIQWDDRPSD